ncbi:MULTISPECIES: hypothetical protein [Chelativorans]|jgi:hypothetical protein|uniref:EPTP domain-containing protein n=1 Tax=Chelativorans sp. (strain BNC1) TaxID=266779 RepID=Q11BY4_CHESB|nr:MULTISPECIES: hypothetical protein [Chelativorans]
MTGDLRAFEGEGRVIHPVAAIETFGARAAAVCVQDDNVLLAVPQLAKDIEGSDAHMNGGTSDVDMPLFRWMSGAFVQIAALGVPGGEDAEFFEIGGQRFLATASARSGRGPYEPNLASRIWRLGDRGYEVFQDVPTFYAKQVRHLRIGSRDFLAYAVGVTVDGPERRHPSRSFIYEWRGHEFVPLQTLDGEWGYNFSAFSISGREFLAYADHVSGSRIYEWRDGRYEEFQLLPGDGGRAFQPIRLGDGFQLAFATISGDVSIFEWTGEAFEMRQILRRDGGREFALYQRGERSWLVLVRFIEGTPQSPKTDLTSFVYEWHPDGWRQVDSFPSFGATDAAFFESDGQPFLVVAHSLTAGIRFRQDSAVYEFRA